MDDPPSDTILPCRKDFLREEGSEVCVPDCYTWREYAESTLVVSDVVVLLSITIGLLSGVVIFGIAIRSSKRM